VMRVSGHWLPALAVAATLALAGCGGSGDENTQAGDAGATRSAPPATSPTGEPSQTQSRDDGPVENEDDAVEIEVEIENGQVTPSGERVDVALGQTIRFVVDSDVADEIHVHSTPEHTFAFKAGAEDREFEFRLNRPGVVDAELHELGDVVVSIAARP
jgi:plastocyanin